MPPQSRAQRRRQSARQQGRPQAPNAVNTEAPSSAAAIGETMSLDAPAMAARPARTNRRVLTRAAPEPVDYTADYTAVRTDLRWIAIWTALLFVAMFALYFSGIV
jgi:hypothetical protein